MKLEPSVSEMADSLTDLERKGMTGPIMALVACFMLDAKGQAVRAHLLARENSDD